MGSFQFLQSIAAASLAMGFPCCVFTSTASTGGVRHEQAECSLTRLASQGHKERPIGARPPYTQCTNAHCGAIGCVDCYEMLADAMDDFLANDPKDERVSHPVFNAFAARAWRPGVAGHEALFARRPQGGGKWLGGCPACVDMELGMHHVDSSDTEYFCTPIAADGQVSETQVHYDSVDARCLLSRHVLVPARGIRPKGTDGAILRCVVCEYAGEQVW